MCTDALEAVAEAVRENVRYAVKKNSAENDTQNSTENKSKTEKNKHKQGRSCFYPLRENVAKLIMGIGVVRLLAVKGGKLLRQMGMNRSRTKTTARAAKQSAF